MPWVETAMGLYLEMPRATFYVQYAGYRQGYTATINDKTAHDQYELVKGCDDAEEAKRFCEWVYRAMG